MDEFYKSLEVSSELEGLPSPTPGDDTQQKEECPTDLFEGLNGISYTEQLFMGDDKAFLAHSSFPQLPKQVSFSYGLLPSDQSTSRLSTEYLTALAAVSSTSDPDPDLNSSSLVLRHDHEIDDWLHPKQPASNFACIPTIHADAYYFDRQFETPVENTYRDNIYNTYDLLGVGDLAGVDSGEQAETHQPLRESRGCDDRAEPLEAVSSEPIFAQGFQDDLNEEYTFNSNDSQKERAVRDLGYPFMRDLLPLSPLSDFDPSEQLPFADPIYTAGPNHHYANFNSFGGIRSSIEYPLLREDVAQSVAQQPSRALDQVQSGYRPRVTNRGNRAAYSTAHLGRDLTPSEAKLLRMYAASFTYKQIKIEIPEYAHLADSTLRGKVRALVKSKEQRVRKPVWSARDETALIATVEHLIEKEAARGSRRNADLQTQRLPFDQALKKLPWKKVTEMLAAQGFYHYGVFTAKKKYYQLMGIEKLLRES